jgi:ParB family chromosome partitioning protein
VTTVLLDLKPSQIKPHKANVRRDVGNVDELAASIKEKGLLEPLIVAPDGAMEQDPDDSQVADGKFVLIAGHRRLAAARKAKVKTLPCIVRADLAQDPKGQIELMLVENLQRTDLTAVEEAEAYQMLLTFPGYTQTRIAEKTGRAIATVRSRLKLAGLPKSALEKVHAGQIPLMQADALVGFQDDPATFKRLIACAGTDGFARQLDEAARQRKTNRAVERLTKKLKTEGVRVIAAPRNAWGPDAPLQLFGAKGAEEHRECEGFAAYISLSPWAGSANVVYVCDKPQLHVDEAGDDDEDEKPDRYTEQRELLKDGTAVRRAWLRDHVLNDPSDGLGIDLLRQLVHREAGKGYPRFLETFTDELLGVTAGDKKARAAEIDKLDWRQCAILLDLLNNATDEDALDSPHNWTPGSYTKKWRARLAGLYGYTWSTAEHQVMEELVAEAEAAAAADAEDVDDLVEGADGDPLTKEQAEERANWHRGEFGDDVVQHDPEDYGDSFRCNDCDWLVLYVDPDPDAALDEDDES